ncbi:MAG: fasciclin domain-containing protein [Gemmatimonadales bacterium]|jgi:transforming growth factor-beta-induced protein
MNVSRRVRLSVLPLFLGAALVGCGDDDLPVAPTPLPDIVDTAVDAGVFETLVAAVTAADLVATLRSPGPFTVFAPTDEAFAALPAGTMEFLLAPENKDRLIEILSYHVVPGRLFADDVLAADELTTLLNQNVVIDAANAQVNEANIINADIEASNGVVHAIDYVLIPQPDIVETAIQLNTFQTLVAALTAADLVETLKSTGPFTVFAPTDDAFAALPQGTVESLLLPENRDQLVSILTYHVVPGRLYAESVLATDELTTVQGQALEIDASSGLVNQSAILDVDIAAVNGVIHVIDSVLLPQ